jgi:cytochrome c oxidase subunit 4
MSTEATATDKPVPTKILDGAIAPYPRDKLYVQTAVVLALITVVEVLTYVWPELPVWHWGGDSNIGLISILMILMIAKFVIVVAIFMHLKFDRPILWRVFVSGLVLALGVYIAVMLMFRVFDPAASSV